MIRRTPKRNGSALNANVLLTSSGKKRRPKLLQAYPRPEPTHLVIAKKSTQQLGVSVIARLLEE